MTTDGSSYTGPPHRTTPALEELFEGNEPVEKAEDLARAGVFEDGEVEEFLDDLYAMRRSDVA